MGKPLKFASRKAKRVDHPAGGTFLLRPFDADKALDWFDLTQNFADEKVRQSEQYRAMSEYVANEIVEAIGYTNDEGQFVPKVYDVEGEAFIEVTDDIKVSILRDMSDHEIDVAVYEFEAPGLVKRDADGKPLQKVDDAGNPVTEKKAANEPYFVWAISEAGKLWQQRQSAVKNS